MPKGIYIKKSEHGKHIVETRRKNNSYKAWNKGLTKETDERVKKYGENHKSKYSIEELKERNNLSKKEWIKNNPEKNKESKIEWARNNRDKIKEIARIRNNRIEVKEKHYNFIKKYVEENPEKIIAHKLAKKIPLKSNCEICNSQNHLQRHHWRYDKPLMVNTLCEDCHNIQHTKNFYNSVFGGG